MCIMTTVLLPEHLAVPSPTADALPSLLSVCAYAEGELTQDVEMYLLVRQIRALEAISPRTVSGFQGSLRGYDLFKKRIRTMEV